MQMDGGLESALMVFQGEERELFQGFARPPGCSCQLES